METGIWVARPGESQAIEPELDGCVQIVLVHTQSPCLQLMCVQMKCGPTLKEGKITHGRAQYPVQDNTENYKEQCQSLTLDCPGNWQINKLPFGLHDKNRKISVNINL